MSFWLDQKAAEWCRVDAEAAGRALVFAWAINVCVAIGVLMYAAFNTGVIVGQVGSGPVAERVHIDTRSGL